MDISVTIGRNIGDRPMSSARWANFQWAVIDNMWHNPYPVTTANDGEWEGVPEESVTITGETRCFNPVRWAAIARAFSQDAIAVRVNGADHWTLVYWDDRIERGWAA